MSDWFLPRMGGIELHLRDLALALRRVGADARVVTTTRGPAEVDGVPVHRVPAALSPVGGFAFSPAAMRGVGRVLRDEGFDVVHAHASVISPVAYAGALAGARDGLPTIVTFHSMLHASSVLLGAMESLFGWAHERVVLTAVSSVVAVQAARWIPRASVGVLPNGIDVDFWRGAARRSPGDEVLFVTAMRLSRKKRPLELLAAFAAAVRRVAGAPRVRLIVAGDGPERDAMRRRAAELGIADQVTLAGHLSRDALRDLYGRSDVFVLPSELESFGIAALEARAAGLPVLAMLPSGVRDFIVPGEHGLLARDHDELGRMIARLALDAERRGYMAHRNAAERPAYDWADVAGLHLRLYETAGASRGTRPSQR